MSIVDDLLRAVCRAEEERERLLIETLDARAIARQLRKKLAERMRHEGVLFVHIAGLPSAMLRSDGTVRLIWRRPRS